MQFQFDWALDKTYPDFQRSPQIFFYPQDAANAASDFMTICLLNGQVIQTRLVAVEPEFEPES